MKFSCHDLGSGLSLFRGYIAGGPLTFNSYLIQDEKVALMHTGPAETWPQLRIALQSVIPLDALDYVVVPHFESDECGALQRLLKECNPLVLASTVGERQIRGFALADNVKAVKDGEILPLGRNHVLEFITIPSEMHLWDGLMVYDRTQNILFSNDFMSQFGSEIGVKDEEVSVARLAQMNKGNIPCTLPYQATLDRLSKLSISTIAPGHGTLITKNVLDIMTKYFTADFE